MYYWYYISKMIYPNVSSNKIKVLNLFEKNINKYDDFFKKEKYVLKYNLKEMSSRNDFVISVFLILIEKPTNKLYLEKPWKILDILEGYCRYFNISNYGLSECPTDENVILEHENDRTLPINQRIKIDYMKTKLKRKK